LFDGASVAAFEGGTESALVRLLSAERGFVLVFGRDVAWRV
jgi:hypothetical protein